MRKVVGVLFCDLTKGLEAGDFVFFLGVRGSVSGKKLARRSRGCVVSLQKIRG